jgi:hypothetical protein
VHVNLQVYSETVPNHAESSFRPVWHTFPFVFKLHLVLTPKSSLATLKLYQ